MHKVPSNTSNKIIMMMIIITIILLHSYQGTSDFHPCVESMLEAFKTWHDLIKSIKTGFIESVHSGYLPIVSNISLWLHNRLHTLESSVERNRQSFHWRKICRTHRHVGGIVYFLLNIVQMRNKMIIIQPSPFNIRYQKGIKETLQL